ncbi:GNAT family N-acetyltransferase [Brachybacterium endophyticum]|uniref:GNAT family N-acetyltransferase n=1 Tax=Brachybacterium endophyticum TaxID=2182385 RepID=A0A2U2RNP7_9MICO|nr:GNAT family N-acetyltransferase [Brachybacterium endophyticum]PWH07489.1 GNAT family N-acetyltransferase [Brachybacterium endophyticum]
MEITVRSLDLDESGILEQLDALEEAMDIELFGAVSKRTPQQRRALLADTPYMRMNRWVAEVEQLEGGRSLAGVAVLFLPQTENLDSVDVGLSVHPALRGRGVATALIEQALRPAIAATGRSRVSFWGEIPQSGDADDPELPTNRVARRLGVERRTMGVCRTTALPTPDGLLDELAAEAAEKTDGYRILVWEDTVPDEHIETFGVLLRQLDLDDPDEDFESEAGDYGPERIRHREKRNAAMGTQVLIAVALAPDGSFAAHSEIHVQSAPGTSLAFQENTLVMPEHRGHRLGLALKVANHRRLAETFPHLTRLVTWNSHVNPWMISINEKLGYQVAFREIGYQGAVEA